MKRPDISRRRFLSTAGWSAAGLGASGLIAAADSAASGDRRSETVHETEVLVCGGGPAGMAAATVAARQGRKVLLVERYGRLGGMAVQAMVGPLMGSATSAFVDEVLHRIGGRRFDNERLDLQYASIVDEAGASLWLHSWAAEVMMDGGAAVSKAGQAPRAPSDSRSLNNRGSEPVPFSASRGTVAGARLLTKQGMIQVAAQVVVDATGDGDLACAAGAAFEQGRPGDGLMQPMSIMYRLAGVAEEGALYCGSEQEARKIKLPAGTWEQIVERGMEAGELAPTIGVIRLYRANRPGESVVNATQINEVDGTNIQDLTRAELEGRQQAYQVLEFLRRHAPGYERAYIAAMPAVVGVRETRRILGTAYLTRDDCINGRKWPDAVVRDARFPIDIHNPAGSGQAEGDGNQGTAAAVKPYDIPYGCLVPRDIDGLIVAGRCISGSHDAHASYRVQCIAMAIGAAAGAAAATAVEQGVHPRAVDVARVQRLLE
jgi:hypothetical protein